MAHWCFPVPSAPPTQWGRFTLPGQDRGSSGLRCARASPPNLPGRSVDRSATLTRCVSHCPAVTRHSGRPRRQRPGPSPALTNDHAAGGRRRRRRDSSAAAKRRQRRRRAECSARAAPTRRRNRIICFNSGTPALIGGAVLLWGPIRLRKRR